MKTEPIVKNQYYHIYNRGNNREDIFVEEKNFAHFLRLIKRHVLPIAEIYVYCLLKNHFHLLVKTKSIEDDSKISKGFSNLFNSYTKSFNKSYNRDGSLFKKPFSRIRMSNEDYLRTLIVYIHLNPHHHGFTDDFSAYRHSSYQSIISNKITALSRNEVIALFDDQNNFIDTHNHRKDYLDAIDPDFLLE